MVLFLVWCPTFTTTSQPQPAISTSSTGFIPHTYKTTSSLYHDPTSCEGLKWLGKVAQTNWPTKYEPTNGIESVEKNWELQFVNIYQKCITARKEYESKSLEEIRLEDYRKLRSIFFPHNALDGGVEQHSKLESKIMFKNPPTKKPVPEETDVSTPEKTTVSDKPEAKEKTSNNASKPTIENALPNDKNFGQPHNNCMHFSFFINNATFLMQSPPQ